MTLFSERQPKRRKSKSLQQQVKNQLHFIEKNRNKCYNLSCTEKSRRENFIKKDYKMTVVEFFDKVSIDNMISCFTIKPQKIVFIGDNKPMHKQEETYKRFVEKQGLSVEFDYKSINRNNLESIVKVLENIVETEQDIVFDLTGGEDLVLVAMGIVYEKYKERGHIQMHRFNINTGVITDCDNDGLVPVVDDIKLSIEDNIMLYGGSVVPFDGKKGTFHWTLDEEFISDIEVLWDFCKNEPGLWNSQIHTLSFMFKPSSAQDEPLRVIASKGHTEKEMVASKQNFTWVKGFMQYLERYGFIRDLIDEDDYVSFFFKNEQIKKCLTKAGTLLELMVYYYSLLAVNKKGRKYNDALTGVHIDWDSEIHDINDEEKDTENEIDVILMRGLTPVFISCKNGRFDENELYKLNTVAERFGGPYAKKVLVFSYFKKSSGEESIEADEGYKYLKQRATAMDIQLIGFVHKMENAEFAKEIKNIRC